MIGFEIFAYFCVIWESDTMKSDKAEIDRIQEEEKIILNPGCVMVYLYSSHIFGKMDHIKNIKKIRGT